MLLPANGKLVRDGIPGIIRATGATPRVVTLPPEARSPALRLKAQEEARELAEAVPSQVADELADLLEVLMATAEAEGLDWRTVLDAAERKREERGGFTQGFWLLP